MTEPAHTDTTAPAPSRVSPPRVFMIDNYDSFTYNLVQYLGELGAEITVKRNDRVTVAEIAAAGPSHLVVSPGPCTPNEAGISMDAIAHFGITDPQHLADRIVDMIPHVPAMGPAVAAANANGNGDAPLPPQPPQEKPS